jgi:hypothetical protein
MAYTTSMNVYVKIDLGHVTYIAIGKLSVDGSVRNTLETL